MAYQYKLHSGIEIELRMATPDDLQKCSSYFAEFPQEEQDYLGTDISQPELLRSWLEGDTWMTQYRVLALVEGQIRGEATLEWPTFGWMTQVGEIRSSVDPNFRRKGLASAMIRELFILAVRGGLEKLDARIMPQQKSAIQCFEKLGFREEGRLPGFAKDIKGKIHDQIILSTRLDGIAQVSA